MQMGKFEIVIDDEKIKRIVSIITKENNVNIRQVCERYGVDEEEVRYYNTYSIDLSSGTKILKKVEEREAYNYETYLSGKSFAVPQYYGKFIENDEIWIMIENIKGNDLRDMTDELAISAADALSKIQNVYWQNEEEFQNNKTDNRFEVYLERIKRRAASIENKTDISKAYALFLERQLTCPRTLSNGDFLQFNVMSSKDKVYVIDWGFGGIMPYSLDIARFIAHATEDRSTFPFYMNDKQKKLFCDRIYEKLVRKPTYEQFIRDIQLALLNEYVEFVEADEDESGWYYGHAKQIARELLKSQLQD